MPREREVAILVAHGLTDAEIAAKMTLKMTTVRMYVRHIFSKVYLSNRTELAIWALQNGLVGLEDITLTDRGGW